MCCSNNPVQQDHRVKIQILHVVKKLPEIYGKELHCFVHTVPPLIHTFNHTPPLHLVLLKSILLSCFHVNLGFSNVSFCLRHYNKCLNWYGSSVVCCHEPKAVKSSGKYWWCNVVCWKSTDVSEKNLASIWEAEKQESSTNIAQSIRITISYGIWRW
jgi:hypothetical protein